MKLFPHQIEGLKPVIGYEDYYAVDEFGNVHSMVTAQGRRKCILKPHPKNGYLAVNLFKDGVCKHQYIHRLIAEAFIPNPNNLPEVNHIDGDKTNNRVGNLEWCSRRKNLEHAWSIGHKCVGESHGCARLTEDDVRTIRAMRGKASGLELARQFGIAQCTVSAIQLRRIWKEVI